MEATREMVDAKFAGPWPGIHLRLGRWATAVRLGYLLNMHIMAMVVPRKPQINLL